MNSGVELYVTLVENYQTYYKEKEQFESAISALREKRRFWYTLVIFVFLLICVIVSRLMLAGMFYDSYAASGFIVLGRCVFGVVFIVPCIFFLHIPLIFLFKEINERTEARVKKEWINRRDELLRAMLDVFWDEECFMNDKKHFKILGMSEDEYNNIRENAEKDSYEYKMTQRLIYIDKDIHSIIDSIR